MSTTVLSDEDRAKLQQAFDDLSSYLIDETERVFEEIPEVDGARSLIEEVLTGDTTTSLPHGLGKWCGYCGNNVEEKHWSPDRKICCCSDECLQAALT